MLKETLVPLNFDVSKYMIDVNSCPIGFIVSDKKKKYDHVNNVQDNFLGRITDDVNICTEKIDTFYY